MELPELPMPEGGEEGGGAALDLPPPQAGAEEPALDEPSLDLADLVSHQKSLMLKPEMIKVLAN